MVFMRIFVLAEWPSQPSYKEHAELAFTSVCFLEKCLIFKNMCFDFNQKKVHWVSDGFTTHVSFNEAS